MKNVVKNSFYAIAGLLIIGLIGFNNVHAITANTANINEGIVTAGTADEVVQRWLSTLLGFLYLLAVLLGIWGGFNILTASGDEEKVKKGKTIIIQALIGVVVIFLAGSIVEWLITLILV